MQENRLKVQNQIYVEAPRKILQNNVTTWKLHVKVKSRKTLPRDMNTRGK